MADLISPDYSRTKNLSLHALVELFDRYWTETLEAYQSRDGNRVHDADVKRLKEYLADLESAIAYEEGRDDLDLPHGSNMAFAMPEATEPQKENFQNIFWYQHAMTMFVIRRHMIECQSRDQAQGFHPQDIVRWRKLFQDRINFFDNYVAKAQPIDLPQSTSNATYHTEDLVDHTPGDTGYVE